MLQRLIAPPRRDKEGQEVSQDNKDDVEVVLDSEHQRDDWAKYFWLQIS